MNNLLPQWHSHMSFRKVNMQLSREIYLQPSARKTTLHTRFQSCFLDYILANATKIIRQTISSFLYPHKGMFTVTSIPPSGGGWFNRVQANLHFWAPSPCFISSLAQPIPWQLSRWQCLGPLALEEPGPLSGLHKAQTGLAANPIFVAVL